MDRTAPTYKNHRYTIEIVSRAVWLYIRFSLSLRDVVEMLLERGVVIFYQTTVNGATSNVPSMCVCAAKHREKQISGSSTKSRYAFMAGNAGCGGRLTRTVRFSMRSFRRAATPKQPSCLLMRLLKKQGLPPKRMNTDKLRSYGVAKRQVMPTV